MSRKAKEKRPELPTPKVLRAPEETESESTEDTESASRAIALNNVDRSSDIRARDFSWGGHREFWD